MRTTQRHVTFVRPFILSDVEGIQSAGTYLVETDEEEIGRPGFVAYRRVGTSIHLRTGGTIQVIPIDPIELEARLLSDAGQTVPANADDPAS